MEDFEEHPGLIDDDPALDFIIYKEMEKEDKQPQQNGGCFTLVLFLLMPPAGFYLLIDKLL